jgi:hypothetical protein
VEIEQHAAAFRQLLAVHQPNRALGGISRKLDRKGVHASPGHDFDRVLSGGTGRGQRGEQRPTGDQRHGREPRNAMQRFAERV